MNRVRKFLRLTVIDRRLLVSTVLLLGAIRLGLWLLPFQTLRQLLAKLATVPSRSDSSDPGYPDRVVWAVVQACRYVPRATCLTQALAAQVLLVRRGIPARFHIGVAKKGAKGQFEAHAWVENQGKVVIGGVEPGRYTPLSGLERQSL